MARAVSFPNIKPTSRRYAPGDFAQTRFESLNGATTVIRYSNKRKNSELSLTFANISDSDAYQILYNYERVNSAWDYVYFGYSNALTGVQGSLDDYISETTDPRLRWRYAEAPQIESVKPGISTVTCRFTGFLDGG